MALPGVLPNILDWAKQADPDGKASATIVEMLAQTNEINKDCIWQKGNLPLGHKVSARVGLPQGTWRAANQGVASGKSLFAQFQFSIGELVGYSVSDKRLANIGGSVAKFRYNQDMGYLMGFGQQIAAAIFYSNETVNPTQFTGFAPYYNGLLTSEAASSVNCISAGGTASANTSIWLVCWGDDSTYCIFPEGSVAGMQYEDKGDVRAIYDASGNQFEGYTSYFSQMMGLAVANWEYNVRICNVDTTTAGLAGTTPPDIFALMAEAVYKPPTLTRRASGITEVDAPDDPMPGVRPAWYCNRTSRHWMDIQAIRDKNVLLSSKDYAGDPVMVFRDIPIRTVDQLTNTEATIS